VVFEPNDVRLWDRVTDTLRLFLRNQWRQGALFGRTEEQAFFVTCNESTMTRDDILNGRLICEVGIAPVRPAEFVVFRIFQYTAEAQR
jgi:phage tail sheath protein FI